MQVRRLAPDEWLAYRTVRLRALADAPDAFGATYTDEAALPDIEWQERSNGADSAVFVVDGADGLVAMAVGAPAWGYPNAAGVFGMWVDPRVRGQGLGEALIQAVKAWAVDAGYPVLGLGVTTTNAPAISLYARLGFVATDERFTMHEGTDLVGQIMVLPLADPP